MTKKRTCDNLTKLSRKRQTPTRKRRNEPWQINNNATLKILAIKVFKRAALGRMLGRSFHKLAWWKVMTNIRKCESIWKPNADEQIYLWVWENSNWTEKMQIFKPENSKPDEETGRNTNKVFGSSVCGAKPIHRPSVYFIDLAPSIVFKNRVPAQASLAVIVFVKTAHETI